MSEEKKDEGADITDHIMSMGGVATNTDAKETSSERSLPQSALADSFIESKNSITTTTRENDDNISNDSRIKNMDENGNNTNGSSTRNSSPLVLLLCACGITSCYLWYGTVQERLFIKHGNNKNDRANENENITLFLLATNTFSSFLIGWAWIVVGPLLLKNEVTSSGNASDRINKCSNNTEIDSSNSKLNHPLLALTSLTYLTAMAASNEALHYVSYPTCVLAKSSKLIPTMLVGWLVDTWRCWRLNAGKKNHHNGKSTINAMEWVGAALITIGILSFQYIQLRKQKKKENGNEQVQGDSPYGLALLVLSLCMDGLLGACQNMLKQKDKINSSPSRSAATKPSEATADTSSALFRPPSAMETMLYINLYATLVLLPASFYAGQFHNGMSMLFPSNSNNDHAQFENKSSLLVQLNLSASLGQVFIFLTIHHFSPLICTTITTTRKFFTILLSVYKFGHVLDVWQWSSIGLVFGGLYLEIAAKLFESKGVVDGGVGSESTKIKKKVE